MHYLKQSYRTGCTGIIQLIKFSLSYHIKKKKHDCDVHLFWKLVTISMSSIIETNLYTTGGFVFFYRDDTLDENRISRIMSFDLSRSKGTMYPTTTTTTTNRKKRIYDNLIIFKICVSSLEQFQRFVLILVYSPTIWHSALLISAAQQSNRPQEFCRKPPPAGYYIIHI